jgi:hypothetical protein
LSESDPAFWSGCRRGHQLADCVEHDLELPVVFRFQIIQPLCHFPVVPDQIAQAHERAHDFHVDPYSLFALQHRGQHGDSLLSERVRRIFRVPAASQRGLV